MVKMSNDWSIRYLRTALILLCSFASVMAEADIKSDVADIFSSMCADEPHTINKFRQPIYYTLSNLAKADLAEMDAAAYAIEKLAKASGLAVLTGPIEDLAKGSFDKPASYIRLIVMPHDRDNLDNAAKIEGALNADLDLLGVGDRSLAASFISRIGELYRKESYILHYTLSKDGVLYYAMLLSRSPPFELKVDVMTVAALLGTLAYNNRAPKIAGNTFAALASRGLEANVSEVDSAYVKRLYQSEGVPYVCPQ